MGGLQGRMQGKMGRREGGERCRQGCGEGCREMGGAGGDAGRDGNDAGKDAGGMRWIGRVACKWEGCREGCREPGRLQGDGKDARGGLCPSSGAFPEGPPRPIARRRGGIREAAGAQHWRPMHQGGASHGWLGTGSRGRGGRVPEELDMTKPAQRAQVNPTVLSPPPCEETAPCPAESFTIYTVYFIIIEPAH